MRTTLTLDEDVATRLQAEARCTGKPFKAVVNEYLRLGLAQPQVVVVEPGDRDFRRFDDLELLDPSDLAVHEG